MAGATTHIFGIVSEVTARRQATFARNLEEVRVALGEGTREPQLIGDESGAVNAEIIQQQVDLKPSDEVPENLRKYAGSMHVRQVSNALKHLEALRRASRLPAGSSALILEDDATAGDGFGGALRDLLASPPAGWGSGVAVLLGLPAPGVTGSRYQKMEDVYEVTPVCDSYLVDPEGARRLVEAFLPLRMTTNLQLVLAARKGGVALYLPRPNIFVDGSKFGIAVSTLTPNNHLILNPTYVDAREVALGPRGEDPREVERASAALMSSPFKNHPDFVHMRALLERRRGEFARAAAAFSAAMQLYTDNNAVVGAESQFLRQYISNFRDLQDGPATSASAVE